MSVSSSALRKLATLKLDAEQMAGVLDILADQMEAEEARKVAQRDRKRKSRSSQDRHGTTIGSERDTPLDKENTPTPPKEINPPLTPQSPPSTAAKSSLVASGFATFWSEYPNKIGKREAEKAFEKARKRASAETIIAGLQLYVAKTDDRPWCNPSTWLNQDRWEDSPAPSSTASKAPVVEDDKRWQTRLNHARRGQEWSVAEWGPQPGDAGCRVPAHLLQPGDGDGWTKVVPEKAA